MFEYFLPRETSLNSEQNEEYIEKMILAILKEQRVSLSQARGIFHDILIKIEDKNLITL